MLSRLMFFVKESWLLMASSIFFGILLALTQSAWGPRISENQIKLFNKQAGELLPEAADFEPVAQEILIAGPDGAPVKAEVWKGLRDGQTGGWIFIVKGNGFSGEIRLVVAVDAAFETMKGFNVLAANETPGFGDKIRNKDENSYQAQYTGAPVGAFSLVKVGDNRKIDNEIVAITGATVTSQAVVDIMNAYVVPIKEQLTQKGLLQQAK